MMEASKNEFREMFQREEMHQKQMNAVLYDIGLNDREKLRELTRMNREHLHKEHTQLYYAILAVLEDI